jgi:hypothetical protein
VLRVWARAQLIVDDVWVDWSRAVHHVEFAGSECTRMAALPAATVPVVVSQMWAFGDILGKPHDLERVSVALVIDLPPGEVHWMARPPAAEHWLRMTRLVKNPLLVRWRPASQPVWNHRISRPLLVWDQELGLRDAALVALREGRGTAAAEPEPSSDAMAHRIAEERVLALDAVRACTATYGARQWGPTKLGPTADALWYACEGYLDVLEPAELET